MYNFVAMVEESTWLDQLNIEKKNRELKRREEELRIKELRIKEIEAKVSKDLEKIEKGISESKQQLGIQDEKTKENVEALVKVYSSMKPEEAANLIEAIDDDRSSEKYYMEYFDGLNL